MPVSELCCVISEADNSKQILQNDGKILSWDQVWGTGAKRKRRLWEN